MPPSEARDKAVFGSLRSPERVKFSSWGKRVSRPRASRTGVIAGRSVISSVPVGFPGALLRA